mgnify:CR=1 FL=1
MLKSWELSHPFRFIYRLKINLYLKEMHKWRIPKMDQIGRL